MRSRWSRVRSTGWLRPAPPASNAWRSSPDAAFLSDLETKLEAVADDVNGDGKVKVTVKSIWLALDFETQDAGMRQLMESSEDKLNSDFYLCESTIFIVDDPAAMEQRYGCFRLLDGTDPQEGDQMCVADFALPLEDTALAGTQSESGAQWYAARRLSDGMADNTLAATDALWERLTQF